MPWIELNWAMIGVLVTIGALLSGVTLLAMDERNRRKFASREEINGMRERLERDIAEVDRKVERNTGLYVAIDDRTGDLEEKTSLLEERQTQQWARISDQMAVTARTMETVTRELKEISGIIHEHAVQLARNAREQNR